MPEQHGPGDERLFNDEHARATRAPSLHSTFLLFPCFPRELRLKIWHHSLLGRERIIRLTVSADFEEFGSMPDGLIRTVPNMCAGESNVMTHAAMLPYTVAVEGYRLHSKLLRVNSEARAAALHFYRVPLPVVFAGANADIWRSTLRVTADPPQEDGTPGLIRLNSFENHPEGMGAAPAGVLHLNPEHDFIRIDFGRGTYLSTSPTIPDFLQRFKTVHDPCGVGLLNLVVGHDFLERLSSRNSEPSVWARLDTTSIDAFKHTMKQLREVFFEETTHLGRVHGHDPFSDPAIDPFLNQSYPIMALTPTFSRLSRDPRPIGGDLSKVPMYGGFERLKWFPQRWQELMAELDSAEPAKQGDGTADVEAPAPAVATEFHLLIAASGRGYEQLHDRQRGLASIRTETDELFPEICRRRSRCGRLAPGFVERLEATRLHAQQVSPVLGFWLFPMDVVPPLTGQYHQMFRPQLPWVDMSSHWPELAVFDLC